MLLLLSLCGVGQEQKNDSIRKLILANRPAGVNVIIRDGPTSDRKALLFFNDKKLERANFSQCYLDPELIININVIKAPGAITLYGEDATDGAILCKTKDPIDWITSDEMLQQKMKDSTLCMPRKLIVLAKRNESKTADNIYDKNKIAYFDKKFIKEITILNSKGDCTLVVTLKK